MNEQRHGLYSNLYEIIGRTTHAGIAVALRIAETVSEKNLLVIGYDKAERYDP